MKITMYDSIDLDVIPHDAEAVAGYVDGKWPTFGRLATRFPRARHLSIAVSYVADAQALDVERGDASPAEAPRWVRRQLQRGLIGPVIYSSVSSMPEVLVQMKAAGIPRNSYRLWTAHYTGRPHRCDSSCWGSFHDQAGATQYTDRALGRNLDASLVYGPGWFPHDS